MDYSQVAKELNLSDDFNYSVEAGQDSYGCFYDKFYWFNKSEFRDFLLYNLPFLCFETFSGQYGHVPYSIEHELKIHLRTPEIALDVLASYQDFVKTRVNDDNEYSKIVNFCKENLNPGNSVHWIGKFTDLLIEDSDFAKEQREMFHGTSDHVHLSNMPAFRTFLNDLNYLSKIKEEYEIGLEYKGEIEQMRYEPDYYFPTAEESIERLLEFCREKQSQKNVLTIALKLFPWISFKLTGDSL